MPLSDNEYLSTNDNIRENEKAFGFYAYNLSLISTGLSPQEASVQAHQSFNGTSVVNTIQAKVGNEESYGEMLSSANPVPFYEPLMELLVTDPNQEPQEARNKRVKYVLTRAVIENRIEPEEIPLHDKLFIQSQSDEAARAELKELWSRADPSMILTNRLKAKYLERQKLKP